MGFYIEQQMILLYYLWGLMVKYIPHKGEFMKRTVILIVYLFFIVILASCSSAPSTTQFRLQIPRNIKIDRNILTFDAVENASEYNMSINGVITTTTETTYIFDTDGEYRVRVQAISSADNVVDSLFSDAVVFKIRFLNYPTDIEIRNNQVYFTKDKDADSYDVEINGEVFNTLEDLPPYLEPGTYEIRIKARSTKFNESEFSPVETIVLDASSRIYSTNNYQYSVNSTFELPLYNYRIPGLNFIEILETDYEGDVLVELEPLQERIDFYAASKTIYFSTSYMNFLVNKLQSTPSAENLELSFIIRTNLGTHEINLEINRLTTPYSFNGQRQITNFKDDVYFKFETFDYILVSIEGYNITPEDYSFEDGILIIFMEYLLNTYNTMRSATSLEFTVIFEKDGTQIEYMIYIEK
jgi:hypothetical protein